MHTEQKLDWATAGPTNGPTNRLMDRNIEFLYCESQLVTKNRTKSIHCGITSSSCTGPLPKRVGGCEDEAVQKAVKENEEEEKDGGGRGEGGEGGGGGGGGEGWRRKRRRRIRRIRKMSKRNEKW